MRLPLVFLLFFMIAMVSCSKRSQKSSPNIILIMADDMGAETLGSYGNIINKTPVLDSLASFGIQFNNCVSQPLCTPSRVKIMTGKYNYRNYEHFGYLNPMERTFGNVFQENGYATCIAGKWQLNGIYHKNVVLDWNDASKPNHFGFDEYCLWQLTKPAKDGERYANPLIEQNGAFLPRDKEAYGPDVFAEFITDFIERKKDSSFFVYYPMVLPHDPFVPTPNSPTWQDESLRYQKDTSNYKGMIEHVDQVVGKIVNKLKELEIADNTLIIFTADNGTHPSIYSKTKNGIIQGGKGKPTNAGTHVPLIVSWGNNIQRPFEYDGLIEFSDFYPTLVQLIDVNHNGDGKSFVNLLNGQSKSDTRTTAFVHYDPEWGHNSKYRNRFVRTKTYKLYQDGRFYNLEKDVLEMNKLHPDSLSAMELEIKQKLEGELSKHPEWVEQD